jgi:hypothetical protein
MRSMPSPDIRTSGGSAPVRGSSRAERDVLRRSRCRSKRSGECSSALSSNASSRSGRSVCSTSCSTFRTLSNVTFDPPPERSNAWSRATSDDHDAPNVTWSKTMVQRAGPGAAPRMTVGSDLRHVTANRYRPPRSRAGGGVRRACGSGGASAWRAWREAGAWASGAAVARDTAARSGSGGDPGAKERCTQVTASCSILSPASADAPAAAAPPAAWPPP